MDCYLIVYMSLAWLLTEADFCIVEVAEAKALAAAKHARMDSVDSSGEVPVDGTPT